MKKMEEGSGRNNKTDSMKGAKLGKHQCPNGWIFAVTIDDRKPECEECPSFVECARRNDELKRNDPDLLNRMQKTVIRDDADVTISEMEIESLKVEEPFSSLFRIKADDLERVENDMVINGYDQSKPIVVWQGQNVVIDGHTRLQAAKNLGRDRIRVVERDFRDPEEAVHYALHAQQDRRSTNDGDILHLVEIFDDPHERGGDRKSKSWKQKIDLSQDSKEVRNSAKITADLIGIKEYKVKQCRYILDRCSNLDAIKEDLYNRECTINEVCLDYEAYRQEAEKRRGKKKAARDKKLQQHIEEHDSPPKPNSLPTAFDALREYAPSMQAVRKSVESFLERNAAGEETFKILREKEPLRRFLGSLLVTDFITTLKLIGYQIEEPQGLKVIPEIRPETEPVILPNEKPSDIKIDEPKPVIEPVTLPTEPPSVLIRHNTPIEEYGGIYVKREDLSALSPLPPFAKVRGLYAHMLKLKNDGVEIVGYTETSISMAGVGICAIAKELGMRAVIFNPVYKDEDEKENAEPRSRQREEEHQVLTLHRSKWREFGAEIFDFPAGRTAKVNYYICRRLLREGWGPKAERLLKGWGPKAELFLKSWGPKAELLREGLGDKAEMFELGIPFPETVEAVAKEYVDTKDITRFKTIVMCVGSGTMAAGVLKGIQQTKADVDVYGVLCRENNDKKKKAKILELAGIGRGRDFFKLIDMRYEYTQKVNCDCPFPCNPYYDLKSWKWLVENISALKKPVLFWNIGAGGTGEA